MTHLQTLWGGAAGAALAVALFAGWRERVRKRRDRFDRIGLIAWPTVQMVALIVLALSVGLAIRL